MKLKFRLNDIFILLILFSVVYICISASILLFVFTMQYVIALSVGAIILITSVILFKSTI
jgi:hypothetical protein